MLRFSSIIVAGLATSAIACAAPPPSTQVSARDFDVNPLVGQWRGTSNNPQAGRTGTIAFTLRAGESAASGNVVLIPRPDSLLTPAEREMVANVDNGRSVLKITFIRKEGGNLTGTLDPYRDPECACTVITTFQGSFKDAGTIEGTFTTVPSQPGGSVSGGTWRMTRVKRL